MFSFTELYGNSCWAQTGTLHVLGTPRAAALNLVLPNFLALDVRLVDFVLMVIYSKS